MPRKLPPFVECWRDRHGKLRAYFRKDHGLRIPLPNTIGSSAFNAAYQDALAGRLSGTTAARPNIATQGTIEALVRSYIQSREYRDLRGTTKTGYASRLEAIRSKHGHRLVAEMTRERIAKAFLDPYADRPGAALSILKMLRILIRHAVMLGWLQHDPSLGIKRPKQGEVRSWTEAELAQFEARWPVGTKQRLAFALMLNTGQRRSDVHRMTWADVTGNTIKVVQQKTGAKLTLPLQADLRAILTERASTRGRDLSRTLSRSLLPTGASSPGPKAKRDDCRPQRQKKLQLEGHMPKRPSRCGAFLSGH
jgi:enterobacteria phage integrase